MSPSIYHAMSWHYYLFALGISAITAAIVLWILRDRKERTWMEFIFLTLLIFPLSIWSQHKPGGDGPRRVKLTIRHTADYTNRYQSCDAPIRSIDGRAQP